MKNKNFSSFKLLVIFSFYLISCRKNTDILIPPTQDSTNSTKQLNKITIINKAVNYVDSISVSLKSGNLISQIYRDFHNTMSNDKVKYTTNYYYDSQNRIQRIETDNPNSIISKLSFTYQTKIFYTNLPYQDSVKKNFITKIRIDLNSNSAINFNQVVHTGDSVILNYDWKLGADDLGVSFGVSSSPSFNKYPYADYPDNFQLYTDYLWDIDTSGLLNSATSNKGLDKRQYKYNSNQQLTKAEYAYSGCGGCGWTTSMQMDMTWDTTKFSLPFLNNFYKDIYWVSNIEFPIWDPINDYNMIYGAPLNVSGNLSFILSNFKTISYTDGYYRNYNFENTYTNGLLTHKIMKSAADNKTFAEYSIKYE
jgi:hypothetical protein